VARSDFDDAPWAYKCAAGKNITTLSYDLHNQTFLVTGSDGRLGMPVTRAALRSGATVIATSRSDDVAAANCEALKDDFGADVKATCLAIDLSSFASVHAGVAAIANVPAIDAVLHIAATIGLDNVTADGVVGTVEVNAVSPVLMNNLLMPQLKRAAKPRIVHVGSANCYDPLSWPATGQVEAAISWVTGKAPHPDPSAPYYWYSFTKFVLLHYAAELALREPGVASFSVNPGYFRDDPSKYNNTCLPQLLWEPCPQFPDQGATSTFFTAAQPGIELFTGALIDFATDTSGEYWVQSGDSCIPRPLPPGWNDTQRAEWYDALQKLLQGKV
jgi:NAD(P)-dependent dehydrogenase (short-subunit alcohol dehydrogenase family)